MNKNNKLDKNGYLDIEEKDKDWPADNKMARFPDISDPIREALQVAMDKGDKVYEDGIKWTGLKQGYHAAVCSPDPSSTLHAYNLNYSKTEQDRDVYREIIAIAVQLGMEQGRRQIIEELRTLSLTLSAVESILSGGKEILESITENHDKEKEEEDVEE